MHYKLVGDMAGYGQILIYGFVYGLFAFIFTVLIEAWMMRRFIHIKAFRRVCYSLTMNFVSLFLGIPFLILLWPREATSFGGPLLVVWDHFYLPLNLDYAFTPLVWILTALAFTIVIEFLCLAALFKVFEHMQFRPTHKKPEQSVDPSHQSFWPSEKGKSLIKDINKSSIVANLASYFRPFKDIAKFCVAANLTSYAITFTAPYVIGFCVLLTGNLL